MTRMVPRPDWTPEAFVRAVWEIAECRQGNVPLHLTYQAAEVLALFRPAEDAAGAGEKGESSGELPAIGRVVDGQAMTATSADSTIPPAPAPVAPTPAGEPAKDFKASFDREWEANVALREEVAALRAENERLRQQLDPPTQSGSFGATTAKVAGNCTKCNGYIYHDPHHIGEYLHECVPPGENRSDG